ncbi:MAG: hypothetical protein D6815_08175, partial [Candidatus Dadabacteria bacterium]
MRFGRRLFAGIFWCAALTLVPGWQGSTGVARAAVISEFMAVNDTTIYDEDGDSSDWLEIFNDDSAALDLDGYYLTDDPALPTKWRLPAVVVPPGGYLLVWASGKDRSDPSGPLHANFKLSGAGEYLALVAPDGTTVVHGYSPSYPPQRSDVSYGLASDLTTERCFAIPTPGAPNDESAGCGFIEPLVFDPPRGFYEEPFELQITTATPGVTIRFTTDGSQPTPEHGQIYTGPIPIVTTTAVRAIAYGPDLLPLEPVTHTYLFLRDVIRQNGQNLPPEYPPKWTGGVGADYDMDQRVVDDPAYAGEIIEDLKSIPTMSIVTDVANLFDPQKGIYTHISGRGVAWERPVSVEFFGRKDGREFQVNCGLRIQGSRSRTRHLRKHNLRLLFKGIYGPTKLEFPLFPDSDVERFDTIVLTAGHGNSWSGGFERALYLRDTWAKDTQLEMGQVAPHSTYVHLYLNGLYWGLYRPTERPTGSFLAEHYGGDKEEWDVIHSGKVSGGDKEAWNTMLELARGDLSNPAQYAALLEYLDEDNLIDYFIVNLYGANDDWDYHNYYAGRRRLPGAGFKFFSWDAENILKNVKGNRSSVHFYDSPSVVYDALRRKSEEFRVRFGDHVHRHLFNGGALTPERALARLLERAAEIEGAIVGESARWGDNRGRLVPFTRDVEWLRELTWQRLVFFPRRREIFIEQLQDKGLYPKVVAPTFSQHGGNFAPGFELSIEAPDGIVYYTLDGTDPRLPGGAISPSAEAYVAPLALAGTVHVAARARVGMEWSALTEADFVEDTPLRVTELMFHAPGGSSEDYVEVTNIGAEPLDLGGFAFTDGVTFTFAPGTVVAPGEAVLVVADPTAFEARYGPGLPVAGQYAGNLANGGERIRLVDPAGNAFVDFRYEDFWYPEADGAGRSLVARDPAQPVALFGRKEGWRPSGWIGGSPGAAEPSLCSNGVDDDGDGLIDVSDPGCDGPGADTEAPACDDGRDNDRDGVVDLADPGCQGSSGTTEQAAWFDPLMCYVGRESQALWERMEAVITDTLGGTGQYTVRRPFALCLPGTRSGEAPAAQAVDTLAYQVRAATDQPRPNARLLLRGAFGPAYVDTGREDLLLVPAAHAMGGPVSPPDPGSYDMDSYKCYRVKLSRELPKYFPAGAASEFADAFERRRR